MTPRYCATAGAIAAAIACVALAATAATLPAPAPTALAVDAATTINGVEAACTGIGQTRADPRWQAYGVRLEFSNAKNEYLVGGAVQISDASGHILLAASCDAPWVLLKLPAGDYRVEARLTSSAAAPRSARFHAPAQGQLRVVLQFPDA